MKLKPTMCEAEILDVILREIRRTDGQVFIYVDPYLMGGGANVTISHNPNANAYSFDGEIRGFPRRRRRRRRR